MTAERDALRLGGAPGAAPLSVKLSASLLAAVLVAGCAGTTQRRSVSKAAPSVGSGIDGVGDEGDRAPLPTGIEVDDAPTQRTFTFRYNGPGEDGVLSLTLRLEAPDRFLLTGRDRILRRQVWSLAVAGDRGLLVDPRAQTYCWYGGEVELSVLPLGPLPLATLPALLLGRVPIPPSGPATIDEQGRVEFSDSRGRRWKVRARDGEVSSWILYADGEPEVWYSTRGPMRYLSARREELQLRWRENLSEALSSTLATPTPPDGFTLECPE